MRCSIRLADPDLCFCASHAIRFASGETEPLHEHHFRVVLEIGGPLCESDYVVDFLAASRVLRGILAGYDGSAFEPDSKINPTAEWLAAVLLDAFYETAKTEGVFPRPAEDYRLKLELEESPGCWAIVEMEERRRTG